LSKEKAKVLIQSARNRFREALGNALLTHNEKWMEKNKAFDELDLALKELND
jgi:hypothetical protein